MRRVLAQRGMGRVKELLARVPGLVLVRGKATYTHPGACSLIRPIPPYRPRLSCQIQAAGCATQPAPFVTMRCIRRAQASKLS